LAAKKLSPKSTMALKPLKRLAQVAMTAVEMMTAEIMMQPKLEMMTKVVMMTRVAMMTKVAMITVEMIKAHQWLPTLTVMERNAP